MQLFCLSPSFPLFPPIHIHIHIPPPPPSPPPPLFPPPPIPFPSPPPPPPSPAANAIGGFEDHVSFAILCLAPSPDGRYLAAATDASRNIVFEAGTSRQVRNLYGHQNDNYSHPRIAWTRSGQYLLGNSQDGHALCVWDVASGTIVDRLDGHGGQIREICSSPASDTVVTASFDKTVKVWLLGG